MATPDARASGTFRIGGELEVNRLGFGAMRVTGEGVWGEPADRPEALRTLKRLPELNVNFIDTADSYGPDVSEELIREALHPYPAGMVIATKGGLIRPGPGDWRSFARPDYLIQQAHKSRRRLGVEKIDLWQLHRIDPAVPREEQFGDVTRGLLAAQADGRRAGAALPVLGAVSTAAWDRYLASFTHPVPEWFQKRVDTRNTN